MIRVEGRLFYGHKIVLVSESPRLRAMLAPARAGEAGAPPLVQINDIRYHIFEVRPWFQRPLAPDFLIQCSKLNASVV